MTDLQEPEDGGYVAVKGSEYDYDVYQRRDSWAEHNDLGEARWFNRSDAREPALTWTGVTELGEIAYVGQFVDRRQVVDA